MSAPTMYVHKTLRDFRGVSYHPGDIMPTDVWESLTAEKQRVLEDQRYVTRHRSAPRMPDPIWANLEDSNGG